MEPVSEKLIRDLLRKHEPHPEQCDLIDVGSYDVNGTVRPIAERLAFRSYTGADARPGPNVDHVVPEVGDWGLGERWHVVTTANTMEHTRRPWLFFAQCLSLLRPGGLFVIVAPWNWKIHRHPLDCWRILPDGLDALIEDHGLEKLEIGTTERLTFMAARRPERKSLAELADAFNKWTSFNGMSQEQIDEAIGRDSSDDITPAFLEVVGFLRVGEPRQAVTFQRGCIEVWCAKDGWDPSDLRWDISLPERNVRALQLPPQTREDVRQLIDRVSRLPTGRLAEPL